MRKYKILVPVLILLTAASAVLLVFSIIPQKKTDSSNKPFTIAGSPYTAMLAKTGPLEYPLLQTDSGTVFYAANPGGKAEFYEYSSAGLAPYKGKVTVLNSKVTCSNQAIPVKLSYIRQGNKVTGFGLFTTAISKAPVKIVEYAFFKITALPACYGKNGALLLADFDKTGFYRNNKLYTEAFVLNLNNGHTEPLVTNNSRTIDRAGAFRSDWVMLDDGFLNSLRGQAFFLSSRDYNLDRKGLVADILTVARLKPPRTVKGILGLWARASEKGLYYLRGTDKGFRCVLLANGKEAVIKEFAGDYFRDYLKSGNFILNIKTRTLTDLMTGKDTVLSGVEVSGSSVLSVSPDGSRAVIAATEEAGTKQTLAFCNLVSGARKTVAEPYLFSAAQPGFCWIDGNTLLHLRPKNDDGTGLSYCVLEMP